MSARICSLVPAATEVLFDLGLGDRVVAVTHECDWPPEAGSRPRVTASLVETEALSSAEIDRAVAAAARRDVPLYTVDEERWRAVRADVIVAQEVCEVCAVSASSVRRLDAKLIDYSPTSLGGVAEAIRGLGHGLGAAEPAERLASDFAHRLERVRALVAGRRRPRVFVAEWLDPPFAAGHWVPELVDAAGGVEVAGRAGVPSFRTTWSEVVLLEPELVVLAPCGFDVDRTLAELPSELPDAAVVAVDAGGYLSRPGPRLAGGVELLAHLLHPDVAPDPGLPYAVVRAGSSARA